MAKKKLKKALKNLGMGAAIGCSNSIMGIEEIKNKTFLKLKVEDAINLPKAKRFVNVNGKMAFPVDVNANPREISDPEIHVWI